MNTAMEEYHDWFLRNYPEGSVIGDPIWHAEKTFAAAAKVLRGKRKEYSALLRDKQEAEEKLRKARLKILELTKEKQ